MLNVQSRYSPNSKRLGNATLVISDNFDNYRLNTFYARNYKVTIKEKLRTLFFPNHVDVGEREERYIVRVQLKNLIPFKQTTFILKKVPL